MPSRTTLLFGMTAAVVILAGLWLRFSPSATFRRAGFDEFLYRRYVVDVEAVGLSHYDAITARYLETQRKPDASAELPPTRFLYILSGWLWKRAEFGDAPRVDLHEAGAYDRDPVLLSLRHVSALFSSALLLVSGVAAWRWGGRGAGLGVLALMAFAPLQIHMSQHALIDGFFAFWAALGLWALWENLRAPNRPGWLALLGGALVCLVLTKENAFFVYLGLAGLVASNRWTQFGRVTPALLAVGILGPLLGLVILIGLAGGPSEFLETYRLLVTRAEHLDYAILTGDGPWYRYLVDYMVVSPLVLCLAIGACFCLLWESRVALYLFGFVAVTYLVMCNIRYGMNLRYATIWDLPLRMLAWGQLAWVAGNFPLRRRLFLPVAVAAVCVFEFNQYRIFFVDFPLYELAPSGLLEAIRMLK